MDADGRICEDCQFVCSNYVCASTCSGSDLLETVRVLTASRRAYTRIVLRLRAQVEKEQTVYNGIMRKYSTMTHVNSLYSPPYRSPGPQVVPVT
jgi:hypothetical protein